MASEKADQVRPDDHAMPLMEHLRELRKRLIVCLVVVGVAVVACFFFADVIWAFLVKPMNDALQAEEAGTMAILAPLEGIITYLKVAVVAGIFTASPVLFYQVWQFVAPGLYAKEKKTVLPLVAASTVLFLGAPPSATSSSSSTPSASSWRSPPTRPTPCCPWRPT